MFSEATACFRRYGAIALADFGFARTEPDELAAVSGNPLATRMMDLAGINQRMGSPVSAPLFLKDRARAQAWLAAVQAWPEWDRAFCMHLAPVVPNARAEVARVFQGLTSPQ
eukprot:356753-Chlamydomonas_euryale.AAC.10